MKRILLAIPLLTLMITPAMAEMAATPLIGRSLAKIAPPQPPHHNPHAPESAEDKIRVDFAVEQIKVKYGSDVEIRHPHIIPWSYQNFLKNREKPAASVSSNAPAAEVALQPPSKMEAPQLKPDEYMVHAYVKFSGDSRWHHLDVILTEDAQSKLSLRGFFSIPMPFDNRLPPGVVC